MISTYLYAQDTAAEEPGNVEPRKSDESSKNVQGTQVCVFSLLAVFDGLILLNWCVLRMRSKTSNAYAIIEFILKIDFHM